MDIKELTENVEIVQTLGNYPNQEDGLTPEELKAKFDEGCRIIKDYLNRVIVPAIRETNAVPVTVNMDSEMASLNASEIYAYTTAGREVFLEIEDHVLPLVSSEVFNAYFLLCTDTELALHNISDDGSWYHVMTLPLDKLAVLDDASATTGAWSAKKILEMIAQGGTGDIDMHGRDIVGVEVLVVGDRNGDNGFSVTHMGRHDDDDAQVAEFAGVVGDEAVRLRNVAPGVQERDAVNVGQLSEHTNSIVDKLCPPIEEAGCLVQCRPVEGYPLEVTSHIGPSLEIHTGITLTRCGKNLFDCGKTLFLKEFYISKGSGRAASGEKFCCTDFIPCQHLQGQTITLNHPPSEVGAANPSMGFYTDTFASLAVPPAGIWLGDGGAGTGATAVVPEGAKYMRFSVPIRYADGSQIQLELGSTATDYEPYTEKIYTVEPDCGCCGGTYDWSRGLLTVTHKRVEMASLDWQYNELNCYFYADLPDGAVPDVAKANDALSNAFAWEPDTYGDITSGGVPNGGFFDISDEDGTCRIVVACWDADTVDTFLDILTGTDAVLVYPLAEPATQELAATPIPAAAGINTFYSSTGDTQVVGRADPVVVNKELEARIAALEAVIANL